MHISAVPVNRLENAVRLIAVVGALALMLSLGSNRALAQGCEPALLGTANTPAAAESVAVNGSFAYVADTLHLQQHGFRVVDVSDPVNPVIVGSIDDPVVALGVAVSGTIAYLAAGTDGLMVIDVSNPGNPTILGSEFPQDEAWGVALSGTFVYVADMRGGLTVIDASNPASPSTIGNVLWANPACRDVAISGAYAYVANGSSVPGLAIIDISDPTDPFVVNDPDHFVPGVSSVTWAVGVAVYGDYVYVADIDEGLLVVDVSDPANPEVVGRAFTPDTARDVAVDNGLAYVVEGDSEGQGSLLEVFDVRDPANPTIYGSLAGLSNWGRGVAVSEGLVYRAADFSGLQIIDVESCKLLSPDSDGDGIIDGFDNCPLASNPNQADTNGDGIGDACENTDSDGDGIFDGIDNCPLEPNPNQEDTNGNGIGDACEEVVCQGDANGDGRVDGADITSILKNWLNDYSPDIGPGDANGDGVVTFADITAVLINFQSSVLSSTTTGLTPDCRRTPARAPAWAPLVSEEDSNQK
jgi:hypothetical protein